MATVNYGNGDYMKSLNLRVALVAAEGVEASCVQLPRTEAL